MPASRTQAGVTLIELMVTIAVLAILIMLAAPSFAEFSERTALRGAADNVVSVVAAAKEEAIKRDSLVRVDFKTVDTGFCIGAATVASAGAAGCDCSAANCPVGSYPSNPEDLHGVRLVSAPVFGADTAFVIDPKTGMLSDVSDAGSVEFDTSRGYGVVVQVNASGRTSFCTPSGKKAIGTYGACP